MSSSRSLSDGHFDRDDREAVVEIFAEIAALDFLAQGLIRGGQHADIDREVLVSPTRRIWRSCKTRRSLVWSGCAMELISSRKMVPTFGFLEEADLVLHRAGEGALSCGRRVRIRAGSPAGPSS